MLYGDFILYFHPFPHPFPHPRNIPFGDLIGTYPLTHTQIPPPKKVSKTGYFDPKYPVFYTFLGGAISGEPSKFGLEGLEGLEELGVSVGIA